MLRELHLSGVGPAPRLDIELAPRLNVLAGDNGLGKSFLLDVAWWTLTGSWSGPPAWPSPDTPSATIGWIAGNAAKPSTSHFNRAHQDWRGTNGALRAATGGPTLYARVDGGFSVWDPARNRVAGANDPERLDAFHFTPEALWNGLVVEKRKICKGLIDDLVAWQLQKQEPLRMFTEALEQLSPPGEEKLKLGKPARLSLDDVRDHPTLKLPYGEIPLVHASAGVKRIVALAYLVVWVWHEHRLASGLLRRQPERRFVLIMDEVETHLHPRWQRRIVPALVALLEGLVDVPSGMAVQALLSTHSPMVLASLEPLFDEDRDRLFLLSLEKSEARLETLPWAKHGDAGSWLVSNVFGLTQARSSEAEQAIEAAEAFMRGDKSALPPGLKARAAIDARLRALLPDLDPFWPRWIASTTGGKSRASMPTHRRTR